MVTAEEFVHPGMTCTSKIHAHVHGNYTCDASIDVARVLLEHGLELSRILSLDFDLSH